MGDLLDYLNANLMVMSDKLYEETFDVLLQALWAAVRSRKGSKLFHH